jgi:hypothetical protein
LIRTRETRTEYIVCGIWYMGEAEGENELSTDDRLLTTENIKYAPRMPKITTGAKNTTPRSGLIK